ncbi:MAG: AAA family ATPase [Nanoarchaeota archaeon]
MVKKYVLTGGPGIGKSTVLERLDKRIYKISEVASWVIKTELARNSELLPWIDRNKFQKEVLEIQLQWEREIPKEVEIAFLDRGIIDGIAYYQIDGLRIPQEFIQAAKSSDYEKIFLLEPIKIYENTKVRKEDIETAKRIHKEIGNTYKSFGYDPIIIPAENPRARISRILEYIN